jgi:hypothetical protein
MILVLSAIICVFWGTTTFATTNTPTSSSKMTSTEITKYLNSVDFGVDITFKELPVTRSSNNNLLTFDSVEEAKVYLQHLVKERQAFKETLESAPIGETYSMNRTRIRNGWKEGEVFWWGGGNTSLFSLTNLMIKFYYRNGQISKITVNNSYMTGVVGATWTHRRGSGTPLGGTKAKFSVTGTWLVVISVGGVPVSASFNETLNSPSINITVK